MGALGINLPGLITQVVSFVILFVILSRLLYKPLVGMLDKRAEKITAGLNSAEKAKEDAANSEKAIQIQLSEARIEGQKLISQAREIANKFREEEISKVKSEIETEKLKAQSNIQKEMDAARVELKNEFAGLAIVAAEKLILQSLNPSVHNDIIASVINDIPTGNN
jgi:F-type H+-transporting ATPase subunit b